MVDVLTPEQRRKNMSGIRGKDTKPEMLVRHIVHALGYRYRLHRGDLPGRPDLVFISRRKVINIHGCYWHMHDCRWGRVKPATRSEFWETKRQSNVERDTRNEARLVELGWTSLIIWECELRDPDLQKRIRRFLGVRSR